MRVETTLRVYARHLIWPEFDEPTKQSVAEFLDLSHRPLIRRGTSLLPVEITEVPCVDIRAAHPLRNKYLAVAEPRCFTLSVDLSPIGVMSPEGNVLPDSVIEKVEEEVASEDLAKAVGDILIAMAIARPGTFQPDPAQVSVNGRVHTNTPGMVTEMCPAIRRASQIGWPPVGTLSVRSVLEWLENVPGFESGILTGPVGRAVGALTHLTSDAALPERRDGVFWTLLGLEALYCHSAAGAKNQLLEKSQVVLGKHAAGSKRLSKLYDYRSRFVHGDIDLPSRYSPSTADPKYDRLDRESYDAELMATALLLATLQFLAARRRYTLKFKYALDDV